MRKNPVELTEAEWAVIKAIWQDEPATAPAVQEKLLAQTGWTYSTVRTVMDRMVAKGLLRSEKLRNLTLYRSVVTRAEAQRGELLYTLRHAFNGALSPMVQCLIDTGDLSAAELAELEQVIKQRRRKEEGRTEKPKARKGEPTK